MERITSEGTEYGIIIIIDDNILPEQMQKDMTIMFNLIYTKPEELAEKIYNWHIKKTIVKDGIKYIYPETPTGEIAALISPKKRPVSIR
jgi:hypothetical protein